MEGHGGGVESKHDLQSILSGSDRDYLIRNDDHQVYNELSPKGEFEIVFISADEDDNAFKFYFSKMPWLAIPFSDSNTRDRLDELFEVMGIPHLVLLDENGKVMTNDVVKFIQNYGVDVYPFTQERIKEIKDEEEKDKREQPLKFILASRSRDFVISADGNRVSISELNGKTIGLYFAESSYEKCSKFTPKLIEVYEELKAKGEKFEVVMIPLDDTEESFKQGFEKIPWLSLPFNEKSCVKLARYFDIPTIPALVIIGPDGMTLQSDVVEAIEEHGTDTYPFTLEKFSELEEKDKAKRDAQTLESLLVLGDLDFVIGKGGSKVPISDLVGKNILLYFSAHWCPPCRAFLPKLVETYHLIKDKDNAFELIFISSDWDQTTFEEYFSEMPWLALPFGDERKEYLDHIFKVQGIPMLVAIGPTGRTVSTEARELVMYHGADAYPFTEVRLKEIEAENEEMAKGWPKKVKHELHEHELELIRRQEYLCDGCEDEGKVWSFYCEECEFDLHPKCALEENKATEGEKEDGVEDTKTKEGWVCDGDVCHKV